MQDKTDTLEIITPLDSSEGDFSLDLDVNQFSPSGGASGGSPAVSTLSGGGGSLGQGASFMGLHAEGNRFCIIADCSGSMEGPKLDFLKEEVLDVMVRTHLIDKLKENNIYPNSEKALTAIYKTIHEKGECSSCPLANYIPKISTPN